MLSSLKNSLPSVSPTQRCLVGVSGGRDSVVLLDALVKSDFTNLIVVHVNHQLRGEISDGDEAFAKELAQSYGLEFYSERVDVGTLAHEQKKGLELAAREARQAVFARAAQKHSAPTIFLGHHADDHAETVLYNLMRGSNGLKGISFENSMQMGEVTLKVIRPLLSRRRSEIDDYVAEYRLDFREDATNQDPFTARNRIRKEVMPLLQEIMQREVVPAINSAAAVSLEQSDYIQAQCDYQSALDPQGRLYLPALNNTATIIQEAILMRYLKEQKVPDLSRALVLRCLALCDTATPAKANLPGGRWLRRKERRLFITEPLSKCES